MKKVSPTIDCTPYTDTLSALAAELPRIPRRDLPRFFVQAEELSASLPPQMLKALADFRVNGNEEGYLLLRGLPIDQDALPSTPESWPPDVNRPLVGMEPWISLIGMRMGKATGYTENRAGAVFQDVFPARAQKTMISLDHSMSAHGHEADLRWHTEMAYLSTHPNYLTIGCSRADHDRVARTPVVSIRKILPHLSEEHRQILREIPLPWHVDAAFQSETNPDPMTHLRLLANGDDYLRYDGKLINSADFATLIPGRAKEAREALEAFEALVAEHAVKIALQPGDVILMDNFRTAHGRTQYTPRFDGKDRWLNRIFVRTPGIGHASHLPHAEVVDFALRESEGLVVA
jgi:clavaminate synthase/L-asparagine oxygenase